MKSNQKSSHQRGFFALLASALQIKQNHGLQLFCATSFPHFHRFSKNLLCPSSRTKPALFCPISPEAYLLTGRNKGWKNFPSLFPPQAKRGMSSEVQTG